MSYQNLDRDIAHLELVFGMISTTNRIPLSYWQARLSKLSTSRLMPSQRARVEKLEAQLRALEEPESTVFAASRGRPIATTPR